MADVVYTTALDDESVRQGLARLNGEAVKSETNWNKVGKTAIKMGGAVVAAFAIANELVEAYGKKYEFASRAAERHMDVVAKLKEDIGRDLAAGDVGNSGGWIDSVLGGVRTFRQDATDQLGDLFAGRGFGADKQWGSKSITRSMKEMEQQDLRQKGINAISAANKGAEEGVLAAKIAAETDPIKKNLLEREQAFEQYNKSVEKLFAIEAKGAGSTLRGRSAEAEKFMARDKQLAIEGERLRKDASEKSLKETGPGADIFEAARASQEKHDDEREGIRIATLAAAGREKEAKMAEIALAFVKRRRDIEQDMELTDERRAALLAELTAQQQDLTDATAAQFRAKKEDRSRSLGVSGALIGGGDSRLAAVLTVPVDREAAKQTALQRETNVILRRMETRSGQSILN